MEAMYVIGGGSTYPHYIFLAAIEVASMLLIIWYAWRWSQQAMAGSNLERGDG